MKEKKSIVKDICVPRVERKEMPRREGKSIKQNACKSQASGINAGKTQTIRDSSLAEQELSLLM